MPGPYCYEYPRPQVTVDLVVFALFGGKLKTLLIRRGQEPFAGRWAIPGGFLGVDEPENSAARRELEEETGLEIDGPIEPIGFFARPGRDPRGRTITLAFAAVLRPGEHSIRGGDDAAEAAWLAVDEPLEMAFDHQEIVDRARDWLRRGVSDRDLARQILPESYRSQDVVSLFEAVGLDESQARAWLERHPWS